MTCSVMAAELIGFSDMFDCAFALDHDLSQILCRKVPVAFLTNSKYLLNVLSKGSGTSDNRTIIDLSAVREGYHLRHISDIGHVRNANNIADGINKSMHQSSLLNILRTSKLQVYVTQWIIR